MVVLTRGFAQSASTMVNWADRRRACDRECAFSLITTHFSRKLAEPRLRTAHASQLATNKSAANSFSDGDLGI